MKPIQKVTPQLKVLTLLFFSIAIGLLFAIGFQGAEETAAAPQKIAGYSEAVYKYAESAYYSEAVYCVANQGDPCAFNSCGDSGGTIQCDGSCPFLTPPNPPLFGASCTTTSNNCAPGKFFTGTLLCDEVTCTVTVPPADDFFPPTSLINAPANNSWQGEPSFNLTVEDFDAFQSGDECGLRTCYYRVTDSVDGVTTVPTWAIRSCDTDYSITVGAAGNCRTEGFGTCGLAVNADDNAVPPNGPSVTSLLSFSIDRTAPVVSGFWVNGQPKPTLIITNSPITLTWGDSDIYSGINRREIWQTTDAGGVPFVPDWTKISDATSGILDPPSGPPIEGIWWYGVHVIDNVENCITEDGTHCSALSSDSLDTRTSYGPIQVVIDLTPPNTLLDPPPPPPANPTNIPSASFSFTSTESPSTFECELDGAGFGPCTSPISYPSLLQGTHIFKVRATDEAGNTDLSPASYTWLVDFTAPVVTGFWVNGIDYIGPPIPILTSLPDVTITWTAIDIGGSSINHAELWRAPYVPGSCDEGTKIGCIWGQEGADILPPSTTIIDAPGSGVWWYGIRVTDNTTNCITETGAHCGGVLADGADARTSIGPIQIIVNEPPVVDAGPDQSITGSASKATAILNGTVTDDGLPDPPSAVTTLWTLTSGPAPVVFADATAIDTSVTFSNSGEYILRLTADDTAAIAFDEVKITVINLPPVVDAGPDQTVKFAHLPVILSGVVTDDGFPKPPAAFTVQWTRTSGPGIVTFENSTSTDAKVTFTRAGTHVLRLTANDTDLTAFDEIVIIYEGPDPGPLGGTGYSLIPCGVIIDNPATPWDETEDCELKHTLLLIRTLIDFTLWKLVPLILVILAITTGVIFYFSFGSADTLARVRSIWSAVLKGALILLFSWLFLNFLLGILGFDISIFGRWYEIEIKS